MIFTIYISFGANEIEEQLHSGFGDHEIAYRNTVVHKRNLCAHAPEHRSSYAILPVLPACPASLRTAGSFTATDIASKKKLKSADTDQSKHDGKSKRELNVHRCS